MTDPTEPIDEADYGEPDVETPPVSIAIHHALVGVHVHARVFCSEFGPGTTHGLAGTLTFRPVEWEAFRTALAVAGAVTAALETDPVVSFVDDDKREIISRD